MLANYEVWLGTDAGSRLWLFDTFLELEFVQRFNGAGYFYMVIPAAGFDARLLRVDNTIQIWRRGILGNQSLEFFGFLRRWKFVTSGGDTTIELSGPDQNDLLYRRIVTFAAGTTQASITSYADNGMKDVCDENLVSLTGLRALDNAPSIAADLSNGPSIDKEFAWRNVLEVFQEINEVTKAAGNEVFFALAISSISVDSIPTFQFRTYTGRPGANRTVTGSDPVIFSLEFGNLRDPVLDYDYSLEQNFIYTGGQGEGTSRAIQQIYDIDRIQASAWNLREGFKDARHVTDKTKLVEEGEQQLAEMRPRLRFSAKLLDTEQSPYGTWRLGDTVTVFYLGLELDVLIRAIYFRVNRSGQEDIQVNVESIDLPFSVTAPSIE